MNVGTAKHCWDFFNCDENIPCPAKYTNLKDKKCWRVAARQIDYVPSEVKIRDGMKECWNCKFFRLKNDEYLTF